MEASTAMLEERTIWTTGEGCIGCRLCERACPAGAMSVVDKRPCINYALCIGCGMCATKCRKGVINDVYGIYARN